MVAGLLAQVPSFKSLSSSRSDDWIDRMNHVYTAFMLVMFAALVSTAQFVGDPIHCWCPAEFEDSFIDYTKHYCWVKNTYYVPMMETIPTNISERQKEEVTYYQWVPLIFLFQAFMFKFPNIMWKILNGGSGLNIEKICKHADETQYVAKDDRRKTIEDMTFFINRWLIAQQPYRKNMIARAKAKVSRIFCFLCNKREGNYLTAVYLWIKVLFLTNVISQFFMMNSFMSSEYNLYGFELMNMLHTGESMRDSPRFPRVTLCDFQIRQMSNIQRYTVQCVLPINLFNEKIFMFLWFWYFFIAALSAYNLVKWMLLIAIKVNNYTFVKKYLLLSTGRGLLNDSEKRMCRRFAESYLRDDGCFIARIVGMNATDIVVTDLLDCLFHHYQTNNPDSEDEGVAEPTTELDKAEEIQGNHFVHDDQPAMTFRGNGIR